MKLTEAQLKEATKLLKYFTAKTKKMDPDIVASAVIGLCARMCYIAGNGDLQNALGYVENMALDMQTMVFNLETVVKVQKEVDINEANKRLRN